MISDMIFSRKISWEIKQQHLHILNRTRVEQTSVLTDILSVYGQNLQVANLPSTCRYAVAL